MRTHAEKIYIFKHELSPVGSKMSADLMPQGQLVFSLGASDSRAHDLFEQGDGHSQQGQGDLGKQK